MCEKGPDLDHFSASGRRGLIKGIWKKYLFSCKLSCWIGHLLLTIFEVFEEFHLPPNEPQETRLCMIDCDSEKGIWHVRSSFRAVFCMLEFADFWHVFPQVSPQFTPRTLYSGSVSLIIVYNVKKLEVEIDLAVFIVNSKFSLSSVRLHLITQYLQSFATVKQLRSYNWDILYMKSTFYVILHY